MKKILFISLIFFSHLSFGQICFPVISQVNDIYKHRTNVLPGVAFPIPISFWNHKVNSEVTRTAGVLIMPNLYSSNSLAFKNKELTITESNNYLQLGADKTGKYTSSNLVTESSGLAVGLYFGSVIKREKTGTPGVGNYTYTYNLNMPRQGIFIYGGYEHIWDAQTAMGYHDGKWLGIFNKTKYDKSSIKNFVVRDRFHIGVEIGFNLIWIRGIYSPTMFTDNANIPMLDKTRLSIGVNLLNFL
jgi:hypothetical protein